MRGGEHFKSNSGTAWRENKYVSFASSCYGIDVDVPGDEFLRFSYPGEIETKQDFEVANPIQNRGFSNHSLRVLHITFIRELENYKVYTEQVIRSGTFS